MFEILMYSIFEVSERQHEQKLILPILECRQASSACVYRETKGLRSD